MSNYFSINVIQYGGKNGVQMNDGVMNNGQLINNQSSGVPMNGDQMNTCQMNFDLSRLGPTNFDLSPRVQTNPVPSPGVPMNTDPSPERAVDAGQSSQGHMICANELEIEHIKDLNSWKWVKYPNEPRFKEAAELRFNCWLEIKVKINFSKLSLSADTNYAAYLIFQTTKNAQGLGIFQEAYVVEGSTQSMKEVCLKPTTDTPHDRPIGLPLERPDKWMELELGQFYCNGVTSYNEVEVSIRKIDDYQPKTGLIVAGMELRPIAIVPPLLFNVCTFQHPSPELPTDASQSSGGHMLCSRELEIEHIEDLKSWKWVKYPNEPRFKEAAELKYNCWLEIKVKINFSILSLSPETNYAAYLIFRTTKKAQGLGIFQEAYVVVGNTQSMKEVCLKPTMDTPSDRPIGLPLERSDKWMELELGQFYCNGVTSYNEVEISIREIDDYQQKTGLIVAGMELRPIAIKPPSMGQS